MAGACICPDHSTGVSCPIGLGVEATAGDQNFSRCPRRHDFERGAVEVEWTIRVFRRPRLAVALVVLFALGALLAAQNSTVLVPEMYSYAMVNPSTIAVRVGVAPCSLTRVTNIAETQSTTRRRLSDWAQPYIDPCPAENPDGYCPDHGTGVACPIGPGVRAEGATGQHDEATGGLDPTIVGDRG